MQNGIKNKKKIVIQVFKIFFDNIDTFERKKINFITYIKERTVVGVYFRSTRQKSVLCCKF